MIVDSGATPDRSNSLDCLLAKFDELIAVTRAATIPLNDRWLDAADVGALLSESTRYVLERLACRPDFPKPARFGHPRWKASEVLDWVDRYRARQ